MITIKLHFVEELQRQLAEYRRRGNDLKPLERQISAIMHAEVARNFAEHGRDPHWPGLAESTKKRYAKKGYISEPTLDRRAAGLFHSIHEFVTGAGVSTNKEYAAIHNFGGAIVRHPFSSSVRLRTDAKGNLLRQGAKGLRENLAVFAKSGHKRAVSKRYTSSGWTINMPQREFMKISAEGMSEIEAAAADFLTRGRF